MRKKIIFITKYLPVPAHNGGAIRNLCWIKFLSQKYDIILIGLWNNQKRLGENESITGCEIIGKVQNKSMLKKIESLIGWIFFKKSFVLGQYYDDNLLNKIKETVENNKTEFVFCSELSTMQYADFLINKKISVYFDDHNVEYRLYDRMSEFSGFLWKHFLKREARLIKKFEVKALELAHHVFSVSEEDRTELNNLLPDISKITVVKNSFVDKKRTDIKLSENPAIVFVGNLSWRPNKYGLEHFISKILPTLIINIPDVELYVIGSNLPESAKKVSAKMPVKFFINATEEEKEKIINRSWVGIAPLYFASGTRIKIIEYWSHGKAVVSTYIGAEGLEESEGTIIVKSDLEFIEKLVFLLENRDKINDLGEKNYSIFKSIYNPEAVYKQYIIDFFN